MYTKLSVLNMAALFLTTSALAAPFIGEEGSRPATASEKQFITNMAASFKKALPPVPAGWVNDGEQSPALDMSVGVGSQDYGLSLGYTWFISSNDRAQKEDIVVKMLTDAQGANRDESGLPKGAAPIQARMDALGAKIGEAAEKADTKALQKYSAEMDKLGKQMTAAQNGASVSLDDQRKIVVDTRGQINIGINSQGASLPENSKLLGSISGAAFAFRNERDPADTELQREGTTTLLFGPWMKNKATGSFQTTINPVRKYPSVQTVVVIIQAEAKRAEALAKTINAAELQRWLK